jgi:hypothetical protein
LRCNGKSDSILKPKLNPPMPRIDVKREALSRMQPSIRVFRAIRGWSTLRGAGFAAAKPVHARTSGESAPASAAGCKFQFDAATIKPLIELANTELKKF